MQNIPILRTDKSSEKTKEKWDEGRKKESEAQIVKMKSVHILSYELRWIALKIIILLYRLNGKKMR